MPGSERRIIGTAAAIAIALGTAASQTATSIYSTHKAASQNEKALKAEERDAERQATLDREDRSSRERAYQQALDADKSRWGDYVRIHEPYWKAGQGVLGSLYDMAGMQGQAPQGAMPSADAPLAAAPMAAGGGQRPGMAPNRMNAPRMPMPQAGARMPSLIELAQMAAQAKQPMPRKVGMGDVPLGLDALA